MAQLRWRTLTGTEKLVVLEKIDLVTLFLTFPSIDKVQDNVVNLHFSSICDFIVIQFVGVSPWSP